MSVSRYAYVYARVRARMGDLLSDKDWRALVDARKDDFITLLMESPYKACITKLNMTEVNAQMIEGALKQELMDQYLMVIRSTEGSLRDFIIEVFRRFEEMNVKAVIRAKAAGISFTTTAGTGATTLFPVDSFFKRHESIRMSPKMLDEADSLDTLIKRLEEPYRSVLENAMQEYRSSGRLWVLENALDKELFASIWSKREHLRKRDRETVSKVIGTELDIVNLMTMLRCKDEGITVEEMERYFIPYPCYYAFNPDDDAVRNALMADTLTSTIQLLPESPYKAVLSDVIPEYEEQKHKSLIPFELALMRYFTRWVKKVLSGYPVDMGTVLGYLYVKELEIKALCTIAVCKENELPSEETEKLVVVQV